MKMQHAIKKRVDELCKEHQVSIHKLARESGVSHSTIDNILIGQAQNTGIGTIAKLCFGLGVSLEVFFASPYFEIKEEDLYE